MITIKNLTPHAIVYIITADECIKIPASGTVARVSTNTQNTVKLNIDNPSKFAIQLQKTSYGNVQYLPEQEDSVYLIVSAMVRQALPERKDLLSPAGLLRNGDGEIIGCTAFDTN